MKREFLQNIKVGEQVLPKEIIDAILDEHSRSIGTVKAENDNLRNQLQTAKDGLKAFEGVDVKELQGQIAKLQQDLVDKDAAYQTELANMAFDRAMEGAIKAAKGRSVKAILGELGSDKITALRNSKNQEADIQNALTQLQKDSGYLFGDVGNPPPYSGGAGTGGSGGGSDNPFSFNFGGIRPKDTGK